MRLGSTRDRMPKRGDPPHIPAAAGWQPACPLDRVPLAHNPPKFADYRVVATRDWLPLRLA